MLDDPNIPALPKAADPVAENRKIVPTLQPLPSPAVPIPFLLGILTQESGLKHFNEPPAGDEDRYIVVGLDTNAADKTRVTARGYGAGQYTLFHHPPRPKEVTDFMLDVTKHQERFEGYPHAPNTPCAAYGEPQRRKHRHQFAVVNPWEVPLTQSARRIP
jgi:hypothetical protein